MTKETIISTGKLKIHGRNENDIFLNVDIMQPGEERLDAIAVLNMEEIKAIADWYNAEKDNLL